MDRAEAICHWQADLKTLVLPFGLSSMPPTSVVKAASSLEVFDAGKYASFKKLVKITATVINICKHMIKKDTPARYLPTPTDLEDAETYWIYTAQKQTREDFAAGKLCSLLPKLKKYTVYGKDIEIVVTSGRVGGAMVIGYDKEDLPILSADSPIAEGIILDAHAEEHSGLDRTLWRSRKVAWVIRGRRIAKQVSKNCFRCKL